jgi:hypothetical protein
MISFRSDDERDFLSSDSISMQIERVAYGLLDELT